jgi:hypothetical protein
MALWLDRRKQDGIMVLYIEFVKHHGYRSSCAYVYSECKVIFEFTRGRVTSPLFYSLKSLALFILPTSNYPSNLST